MTARSNNVVQKWALGILGALLTAATLWLFTEVLAHGTLLAVQEEKNTTISEKLDRNMERLERIDSKVDRLLRGRHHDRTQ